jgi:hypothetical protein
MNGRHFQAGSEKRGAKRLPIAHGIHLLERRTRKKSRKSWRSLGTIAALLHFAMACSLPIVWSSKYRPHGTMTNTC